MSLNILIIEDEKAIVNTLIYACDEANITTSHTLLGESGIDAIQRIHLTL